MRKKLPFALFSLFLTACTPKPITAPIEQVQEIQQPEQIATSQTAQRKVNPSKNKAVLYQCDKKKTVQITQSMTTKKSPNITVKFKQTSHRLSLAVTRQNSRKYSNIRWIWTEDFKGKGTLKDKNGKVLAGNCVKK